VCWLACCCAQFPAPLGCTLTLPHYCTLALAPTPTATHATQPHPPQILPLADLQPTVTEEPLKEEPPAVPEPVPIPVKPTPKPSTVPSPPPSPKPSTLPDGSQVEPLPAQDKPSPTSTIVDGTQQAAATDVTAAAAKKPPPTLVCAVGAAASVPLNL